MPELIDVEQWCKSCLAPWEDGLAARCHTTKLLVNKDGNVLGFYCGPCGERELEIIKERQKPRARCPFNRSSNQPCLLEPDHTGNHNLPCVEASAHGPHAKGGAAADGNLYQCSGHRFDRT